MNVRFCRLNRFPPFLVRLPWVPSVRLSPTRLRYSITFRNLRER
jgi:hypothetical protein